MPETSSLLEFNSKLKYLNGVYQSHEDHYRHSEVPSGLRNDISKVFAASRDKSLNSIAIEKLCYTDELRSHLDASLYAFLHSINLHHDDVVLDLSEDFGACPQFISEHVEHVDVVRVDVDKAWLSSERCADNTNLCFVNCELDQLKLPKHHYSLIILGALEHLQLDSDERLTLLSRLRNALQEGGTIIINAPNPDALSAWFGDQNTADSNNALFQSVYKQDASAKNTDCLSKQLQHCGFAAAQGFATFSKGARYSNLFSKAYLEQPQALNHFNRIGAISDERVCEYLLFRSVAKAGSQALFDAASRHLWVAADDSASVAARVAIDFAHYHGTSRKPHWRTMTYLLRETDIVHKALLIGSAPGNIDQNVIGQDLSPTKLGQGSICIAAWYDAVLALDSDAFAAHLNRYMAYLESTQTELGNTEFQKIGYDLLPFNILDSGPQLQHFDTEWHLQLEFSTDFILFRALFWFAFENKTLLAEFCRLEGISNVGQFVCRWHPTANTLDDLASWIDLEETALSHIDNQHRSGSVRGAIHQSINSTKDSPVDHAKPQCQLQWATTDGQVDELNTRAADWELHDEESTRLVLLMEPPPGGLHTLRVDPLARKAIFQFEELRLLDSEGNSLVHLPDAQQCLAHAKVVNCEISEDLQACIALNDDPYFLFDLSEFSADLSTVSKCEISLKLIHDHVYNDVLSQSLASLEQTRSQLSYQADRMNEVRAEIVHLRKELEQARNHRSDLYTVIQELQREKRAQANRYGLHTAQLHNELERVDGLRIHSMKQMNRRLKHLNDQLVDQINHNRSVDHYLMQRPSTRIKGMLSRTVRRALGQNAAAKAEIEGDVQAEVKVVPEQGEVSINKEKSIEEQVTAEHEQNTAPDGETTATPAEAKDLLGQNNEDYDLWVKQNSLSDAQVVAAKVEIEAMDYKPVFSILVPVYNTDPDYLLPMIRSVQAQIYPHWQLCLVDDCSPKKWLRKLLELEAAADERICLQINEKNQGISLTSNDALALATGDYIGLLDHDDELSIDALYENAKVINAERDVGLIYSDEDKMDLVGNRLEPYFKPDYSPDLLDTNNYICHFTVIRKSIAERIGGFREGLDGSQDHDIILRAIAESEKVIHIPKILYHWRKIPGSTAVEYDSKSYAWEAGRQAVEDCLQKRDENVRVEYGSLKGTYRVFRDIKGDPLVSIIIPFKDKPELLDACVSSILEQTHYANYEVIGVSNSSEQAETFAMMETLTQRDSRVRFVEKNMAFNFSAICNHGVEHAQGDFVVLLNNDIVIDGADWLERLLEHAQRPEVGAVGGKLLYPDGRIQHAGVVVGMVGAAGHPHKFFPDNHIGYHGRLHMVYNVSAVTGAMLMVRRDKYLEVGGLDEENFAVAYNDVDFCLKLLDQGYLNVFTPHCRAVHHESVSRGYEDTEEKVNRLKAEQSRFLSRWSDFLKHGDPYYNPNLSLLNESFSLKFAEERANESTEQSV